MRNALVLLPLCGAALACDSHAARFTAPFTAEVGTYQMRTANGVPLPATLAPVAPGTTRQMLSDTLVLSSGGNVRESRLIATTTTSVTPNTTSTGTTSATGRYTITRDSLHLSSEFVSPTGVLYLYGRYAADTVRLIDVHGFVYVFTRR